MVALVIGLIVAVVVCGVGAILFAVGSKTTPPTTTAGDTGPSQPTQAGQPAAPAAPQPKTIYSLKGNGTPEDGELHHPGGMVVEVHL